LYSSSSSYLVAAAAAAVSSTKPTDCSWHRQSAIHSPCSNEYHAASEVLNPLLLGLDMAHNNLQNITGQLRRIIQ